MTAENQDTLSAEDLAAWVEEAWNDAGRLRAIIHGALDAGRATEVQVAAQRLRDIDDDLDRAAVLHAQVLRMCGEQERAEHDLRAHIKARGGAADTWFALAPLAAWRGDESDVNTVLDTVLAHDPNHADALHWGWGYQRRHHGERWAATWLRDRSEGSWLALTMRGEHALAWGDTDTAMELFHEACRAEPRGPGPLERATRALAEQGSAEADAATVRITVRCWTGERGPWPLIAAVEAHLRLGQVAEATLLMARLRGLVLTEQARPVVAELERRVQEAARARGL
ncbi:hypothetical protein RIF23_18230 [Lipingzhangella sp. LS1_29]|uniref:Tetratricopeptide repeat protein n=1 Tax=Lipingzhangella rawalii TaxID=2055835 RepID=A0ABU2HA85_9ACTN|nr:hypothetical protein [Lipingzhangella rawalii]MDS1272230.1 hypothetical protein [Lipingzhangella rawalii]